MSRYTAFFSLAALALLPAALLAQDDTGFSWENATELSYAQTGGNASSRSFALGGELIGSGGPNTFKLEVGGIRASSAITTRTATGAAPPYTINETSTSELSAASYFARSRYDRAFSGAFLFGGAGWDRNTFSGVENRYSVVVGIGRTWVEGDAGHFKTDVGGTYTVQKDVAPVPGADDAFAGARLSVDAARSLTATTDFTSQLIADQSIEQGADFRADWINSIAVTISEGLALKTSFQILYDHEPAFVSVPLLDGSGTPTGTNVPARGEEVDTVLTLALVIKL